jgi:hypothetical protein
VGLILWFQNKPLVNIALAMTYSLIVGWIGGFISANLVWAVVSAPRGVVIGLVAHQNVKIPKNTKRFTLKKRFIEMVGK